MMTSNDTGSYPLTVTGVEGPCLVRLESPEAGASWDYRIPEGLACNEGVFKMHEYPVLNWEGPDANGCVWHEWEATEEDRAIIAGGWSAQTFNVIILAGLSYKVSLCPTRYGLQLEFAATNLRSETLHNVNAFPCLGNATDNFRDNDMERTFIMTEQGVTCLKDTDRGTGDPCRTHFAVKGMPPRHCTGESFWGELSDTVAVSGAIARTSADGRFTVATDWDAVCEIYDNQDAAHGCIHSVPTLGDLAPGERKTVCGRIVLVQGDVDTALALVTG